MQAAHDRGCLLAFLFLRWVLLSLLLFAERDDFGGLVICLLVFGHVFSLAAFAIFVGLFDNALAILELIGGIE